MYNLFIKRMLDIIFSLVFLAVLWVPIVLICLVVKYEDPGPALFVQKRVGRKKNGQLTFFNLYKIRTMKLSAPHDLPTHLIEKPDLYFFKFGKTIRKFSLDELPQLFNILKGDMSFIGPRPALWNQEDLIEEREKVGANGCKPGLTGWAQVNGRDELMIQQKAAYDGEYVSKQSFVFDLKCLLKTIPAVLTAKGVR